MDICLLRTWDTGPKSFTWYFMCHSCLVGKHTGPAGDFRQILRFLCHCWNNKINCVCVFFVRSVEKTPPVFLWCEQGFSFTEQNKSIQNEKSHQVWLPYRSPIPAPPRIFLNCWYVQKTMVFFSKNHCFIEHSEFCQDPRATHKAARNFWNLPYDKRETCWKHDEAWQQSYPKIVKVTVDQQCRYLYVELR